MTSESAPASLSFGAQAAAYERGRPSYPPEAIDWLLPPNARDVLDLGAGTGKLTTRLVERGLDVVVRADRDAAGDHEHVALQPALDRLQRRGAVVGDHALVDHVGAGAARQQTDHQPVGLVDAAWLGRRPERQQLGARAAARGGTGTGAGAPGSHRCRQCSLAAERDRLQVCLSHLLS